MQNVSQAYLLGVSEGRASLKSALADGIDRAEYLAAELATLRKLLAQGFTADMRDCFRGQLDFVANQMNASNAPRAALSRAVSCAIANGSPIFTEIKA